MKNRPVIIVAFCFVIVIVLFFGTGIAVRNFIDIPIVPLALAALASFIMGIVFSFKALKREKSMHT